MKHVKEIEKYHLALGRLIADVRDRHTASKGDFLAYACMREEFSTILIRPSTTFLIMGYQIEIAIDQARIYFGFMVY